MKAAQANRPRSVRRQDGDMRRALLFAPLAAPLAVFVGAFIVSTFHRPDSASPNSVVAIAFWGWVIVLVGAPPAYAATLAVLWPASRVLIRYSVFTSLTSALCGALAGQVIMPIYLRVLAQRGTISLFPGAGAVAGAAVGISFWCLAHDASEG